MSDTTITKKAPHNKGRKLFNPGTVGKGQGYTEQQKNNVLGWLSKRYDPTTKRFERGTMITLKREKGVTYNTAMAWAKGAKMELPTVKSIKAA